MPGDTVEKLYYDTSLAANRYSFSWKDYKNSSHEVYAGMIITEDTILYASYEELDGDDGIKRPNDWLTYTISYNEEANSLYATLYGGDLGHENYPTTAIAVEIPSFIYVTKTDDTSLDYSISNGTFRSIDDAAASKMQTNQTYPIPVTRVEGNSDQTETTAFRKVVKMAFIGDNITYIGPLLADNDVLEEVYLPYNNPETNASFKNCTALKTVYFPQNLTTIGTDMFNGCSSLTSLEVPDGVISIGADAFANCTKLKTVTISDTVATIKANAFKNDSAITDFTVGIAEGATSIADNAFKGCSGLTSLTLPESISSIGSNAFANRTGLTSITIPDAVTDISEKCLAAVQA